MINKWYIVAFNIKQSNVLGWTFLMTEKNLVTRSFLGELLESVSRWGKYCLHFTKDFSATYHQWNCRKARCCLQRYGLPGVIYFLNGKTLSIIPWKLPWCGLFVWRIFYENFKQWCGFVFLRCYNDSEDFEVLWTR